MYAILLFVLCFIVGVPMICHSKVIVNLRIYNYQNENDIKHDGWRCEKFHWANDHCDPMFTICVTSRRSCDVLNHKIDHWTNKKFVNNVLTRLIKLDDMQRSIKVDVRVDDSDHDGHDHIAQFKTQFEITKLNENYVTPMIVTPTGLNVGLFASITVRCDEKYYGPNCDKFCQPKSFNYDCNLSSGEKISILDCGPYGQSELNVTKNMFICKCNLNLTGEHCEFSNFENCAKFKCEKNCTFVMKYKYCQCKFTQNSTMCQEELWPITRTIQPSTTSLYSTREWITKTRENISNETKTTENVKYKGQTFHKDSNVLPSNNQGSFSATTIVMIFILLLLCVSVISLTIIIRNWRKKDKLNASGYFSTFHARLPLPPVVYTPNIYSTTKSNSLFTNSILPETPNGEYDICTIQTDYNYEAPLIKFDPDDFKDDPDVYEEPNRMDSLTCQTDIDDQDDESHYEVPRKIF